MGTDTDMYIPCAAMTGYCRLTISVGFLCPRIVVWVVIVECISLNGLGNLHTSLHAHARHTIYVLGILLARLLFKNFFFLRFIVRRCPIMRAENMHTYNMFEQLMSYRELGHPAGSVGH